MEVKGDAEALEAEWREKFDQMRELHKEKFLTLSRECAEMRRQCEELERRDHLRSEQNQARSDGHAASYSWPAHIHPSSPLPRHPPSAPAPYNSNDLHPTSTTLLSVHDNDTAVPDPFAPYRQHYGASSQQTGVLPSQTTLNPASPQRTNLAYRTYAPSNGAKRHTIPAPRVAETRSSLLRKQTTLQEDRNEDTHALFKPSIFEYRTKRASNHSAPNTPTFALAVGAPKYVNPVPQLKAKTTLTRCPTTPPTPKRVLKGAHRGIAARNGATSSTSPIKMAPALQPSVSKGMDRSVLCPKGASTPPARKFEEEEIPSNSRWRKPPLPSPPRLTSSREGSQRELSTEETVDCANGDADRPSNRRREPSRHAMSPKTLPRRGTGATASTLKPSILPQQMPVHLPVHPKPRVPRVRASTTPERQSPFKSKLGITVTVPRVEMTKIKGPKDSTWKALFSQEDSWPWSPKSTSIPPEHSLSRVEGASTHCRSLQPTSIKDGSARRAYDEDVSDISLSRQPSVHYQDIEYEKSLRVMHHGSRSPLPLLQEPRTPLIRSEPPDRSSFEPDTSSPLCFKTSAVASMSALDHLTQDTESQAARRIVKRKEGPVATIQKLPKRSRRGKNGKFVWNPLNQPCLRAVAVSNKKLAVSPATRPRRRKPLSIRDCEPWGGAFRFSAWWEEANGSTTWWQHKDRDNRDKEKREDDSPHDNTVRRQISPRDERRYGGTQHSYDSAVGAGGRETTSRDDGQRQPYSSPCGMIEYDSPRCGARQRNAALSSSPPSVGNWDAATFRDDGWQQGDNSSRGRVRDTACSLVPTACLGGASYRDDAPCVGNSSMRTGSLNGTPGETGWPRSDANARSVMRNAARSQQQTASGGASYSYCDGARQRSGSINSSSVATGSRGGGNSRDICQPRRDARSLSVVESAGCSPQSTASWGNASYDDDVQKGIETSISSTTAASRGARNSHDSSRSRSEADSGVMVRYSVRGPQSTASRNYASYDDDVQKRTSTSVSSTAASRGARIPRDSSRSRSDADSRVIERSSARSPQSAASWRNISYDDHVRKRSGASNSSIATTSRTSRDDKQRQNASPSTAMMFSPRLRSTCSHRAVSPRVFATPRRRRSLSSLLRTCVDASSDEAIMRQAHQEHFHREAAATEELAAALEHLQRMCPDGVMQFDEAFNALEESFQIRLEALNRTICAAEKRVGKDRSGPRVQGAVRYCLLKVTKVAWNLYSSCAELIDMMREREELKRRGFSLEYGRMEELAFLILQKITPSLCTEAPNKYKSSENTGFVPHWRGVPYSEVIWLERCRDTFEGEYDG